VIESCRSLTGQQIPVLTKPRRPGDPARLIAASEKIQRELGWRPRFQSLQKIIESAWAWHQQYPLGYGD
jgi:UDP-glucose 4-epimerase